MCRRGTGRRDKDAGSGRQEKKQDCVDGGQVGEIKVQDTAARKGWMSGQMGQVEVTSRRLPRRDMACRICQAVPVWLEI